MSEMESIGNGLNNMRIINNSCPELDVFVMSESGKPVYCYTRREDSVTLMGVCVALINFVEQTLNDSMRSINTSSGLQITFSVKTPLIFVVISRINSGIDASILINQVNAQIISILTSKTLKSVFIQRPTFDLKRLLSGIHQ
jgi:hypothetical protein